MKIVKLPKVCLGTRVKHYGTFSYLENEYTRQIPAGYCNKHNVGESVDMKYLKGVSTILFPTESVVGQVISFAVLGLFGLALVLYSLFKKTKARYLSA